MSTLIWQVRTQHLEYIHSNFTACVQGVFYDYNISQIALMM